MKALVYQGPKELALIEREIPAPGEGEVLLEVKACGICGSDIHGYLGITGRRLPGIAMGHEFSAVVTKLGKNVTNHHTGERVIVQPIDSCGHCFYCKEGNNNLCPDRKLMGVMEVQGAMAEYISVPEKLLVPMADSCSFERGALAEPFAVAYAAVNKVQDYSGKKVLVIGAGMIGICILEMLKLKRPAKIVVSDLSDARLKRAKQIGADEVINPKRQAFGRTVAKLTDGALFDVSIEAVGVSAAANQSIQALRKNGLSIWTGVSQHEITLDMHEVVTCQRTIAGSMNYTQEEFRETVRLLESGRLDTDGLITRRVALEQAAQLFDEIYENPDDYLKVMIVKENSWIKR